jgi:hypothetical protein
MGFKATKGIWKEHTLLTYLRCLQTLPSKQKRACAGTHASSASAEPASVKALLSIPAIRALTISGFALTFLSLAFDVVFTLFCYTPVDAGGLGLEVSVYYRSIIVQGTMHISTALDDRKCARVRRNARRPAPVLRHAVYLAAFRLRKDIQCVHVHLARRFWAPSIPQRPRSRLSVFQFQCRIRIHIRLRIRARMDRPSHPARPLQNRGHPTQPQHAPYQAAHTLALVTRSE